MMICSARVHLLDQRCMIMKSQTEREGGTARDEQGDKPSRKQSGDI